MACYKFNRKFHSDDFLMIKGRVENLKLPLNHNSLYHCLYLVLLWLGFLKLNGYFEKHHRKKRQRKSK